MNAAAETDEHGGCVKRRFKQAIDEFNRRLFFECHETLEAIWMDDPRPVEREFFQGILQIAVGFYHLSGLNYVGARNLLNRGIQRVDKFYPERYGVNAAELAASARRCLDEIERLGKDGLKRFDQSLIPTIRLGSLDALEKEWAQNIMQ